MKGVLLFLVIVCAIFKQSNAAIIVDPPLDAYVVGFGATAVYVGRELQDAGLNFEIGEWSNRPFGRVHTIEVDDVNVEMGAMWLQEADRNKMIKDAEDLDIDTKKFDQNSVSVFTGGVLLTQNKLLLA